MSDSYLNPTPLQSQHANENLGRDLTPLQARKRRLLRTTTGTDRQRLKRTRVTETHQTSLEHLEQIQTSSDHPEPRFPGRPVSFPRDFPRPRHDLPARVSEWLETIPEARPQSDSHHSHSAALSEMGNAPDAGDLANLASVGTTGPSGKTAESSSSSLVKDPLYRDVNLATNHVFVRPRRGPRPEFVTGLVDRVNQRRDSEGPLDDEILQDGHLEDLLWGPTEAEVQQYAMKHFFPTTKSSDTLRCDCRLPMARRVVPGSDSEFRVSIPVPDVLYGYNLRAAFPRQQAQLNSLEAQVVANSKGLAFPFLVVEFKGGAGNFWVADNQCLGATASCVEMAEILRRKSKNCGNGEAQPLNTTAFSICMNGSEARLNVSWKHDEVDYYTAHVKSFLIQEPEHFREFLKVVRNIIDWGNGDRLKQIQASLDSLPESGEQQAKPHQSLPDGSAASSGTRRRPNRAKAVGELPETMAEADEDSPEEEEASPEEEEALPEEEEALPEEEEALPEEEEALPEEEEASPEKEEASPEKEEASPEEEEASPEEEEASPETIAPDAPTTPTLRRSLRFKSLRSTAQNTDSQS
ncbi:hypothetical protein RB598_000154 [Gaeumannomyces tritici]